MVKGLYTAYTGMLNQQNRLDVLTNNLANSATNGFKKEGSTSQSFDETLAIKIKDTSAMSIPRGLGDVSLGVKIGECYTDYGQGSFRVTDNVYDFALDGDGFFAISFTNKAGETSVKYTRDGAFTVNREGYLMTKDGDFVLNQAAAQAGNPGQAGYIQIDPNVELKVDENGNLYQNNQLVGQVGVVDFADYNYLAKYGENMYDLVEGGQVQASDAQVIQGTLEMSNVNVVSEMVEMITISRAYETNQKIIQSIDETLEKAVNNIGKA
ncbi:flagellar hook-basal body protein [Petralouisia muris]|jgi:flagellar basal-body rod protein FlgG|uniref:Flagellar hook-basal body protein n=1 Tax=Petralouisia muris TaxID=3032872 RepID=A0AC61RVB1_9FIRM|nr:flagellar hook-basal body protein [Petralouisia muris]TGY95757.1 flagellar hook-basal body protein [Petralouisia muris]